MEREQPTNLPLALSRFFGRQRELRQLGELVSSERIVTLVGTGGVGKTRLSLEVARRQGYQFPAGRWVAELASLEDPRLLSASIADAVRAAKVADADSLAGASSVLSSGRHLLVLDNCEHVLEGVAAAAIRLLTQCPDLAILATSRQPIGIDGEHIYRLDPLTSPDPTASAAVIAETASFQLFCDRAQLKVDGEAIPSARVADIAEICRRVDGLPLALELAAAWVRILSVKQVVERLDDSLVLSGRGDRTRAPRHRTMRAALDWSVQLLDQSQRTALMRLAIFVSGFDIEAAEAVLLGLADGETSILDVVAQLVDRSLLVADTARDEARYHLLEPVRQYGVELLSQSPAEEEFARRAVLDYLAGVAEAAEEPMLGGPDVPWLRTLDAELPTIRSALNWGFDVAPEVASRLATALIWYCGFRDLYEEGRAWATNATIGNGLARAKALHMAGWMSVWLGADNDAMRDLHEASRLMSEGEWWPELSMVLFSQANAAYIRGDVEGMRSFAEESVAIAQRVGDEARVMVAEQMIALIAFLQKDYRRALDLWRGLLDTARRRESQWHVTAFLANIVDCALTMRDTETAVDALWEGFEAWGVQSGGYDIAGASYLIEGTARLAVQRGDATSGLRLLASADAIRARLGYRETPDEVEQRCAWIDEATAIAGATAARAARQCDAVMPFDQAIADARALVASLIESAAEPVDRSPIAAPSLAPTGAPPIGDEMDGRGVLLQEGDFWSMSFGGKTVRIRAAKGIQDLSKLLASPRREFACGELIAVPQVRLAAPRPSETEFGVERGVGPLLDEVARNAYRGRLSDLEEEISDAETCNDTERLSRARQERGFLLAELGAAVGLGGRNRSALDPAERARKAVAWRIRDSIARIERLHPALGRHLRYSVRTGAFCVYDPPRPTHWTVDAGG